MTNPITAFFKEQWRDKDKESRKEQRYAICVGQEFMDALTALAKQADKSKEDVIRDALNYYQNALNEWSEGGHSGTEPPPHATP